MKVLIRILKQNQLIWMSLRSEEHTSELQSRGHLVCRLLLEKKKKRPKVRRRKEKKGKHQGKRNGRIQAYTTRRQGQRNKIQGDIKRYDRQDAKATQRQIQRQ